MSSGGFGRAPLNALVSRFIILVHMARLRGTSATLMLLSLACSSAPHEDFFKESDPASGGAGTTTSGAGGVNGASTLDTSSTTTSGGASTATSDTTTASSTGTAGGETGPTTTGTSGGFGTGGDGTAGTGGQPTSASAGGSGGETSGTGGHGTGATGGCSPSDEVCDGVDNDCDDAIDEDDVCPDDCEGVSFQGRGYMFCDRPPGQNGFNNRPSRTWQQAMEFCMTQGQVLVSIQTGAENEFVYAGLDKFGGSGDVWMGATDQDSEDLWSWVLRGSPTSLQPFYDDESETPLDDAFVDWRSGEPNDDGGEDCGVLEVQEGDSFLWDDRSCSTQFDRFVCEESE